MRRRPQPPKTERFSRFFDRESDMARRRANARRDEIIHEDGDLLVINKAAEELEDEYHLAGSMGAGSAAADVTLSIAAYQLQPQVSGAIVLCKSEDSFAKLTAESETPLTITCLAIVRGHTFETSGTIEKRIGRRGQDKLKIEESGKPATLNWRLVDRFIAFAVLECDPFPPVPDHVRLLLQTSGMPLAVDRAYGGGDKLMLSSFKAGYKSSPRHPEFPLIQRVSMHVKSVSFTHPTTGQSMKFEASVPKDFRATLNQLDRFGRTPK